MQANLFRSTSCLRALKILAVIALLPATAFPEQKSPPGKAIYSERCFVCHGASGKGNGPYAPLLTKRPADLTQLAKKNNGVFPEDKVASFIDGRQDVAAHGPREMPIWGERFAEPEHPGGNRLGEAVVHKRIQALVQYLSTIQEK